MTIRTRVRIMRPGQPDEITTVEMQQSPGYSVLLKFLTPLLDGGDLEHVSVLADFDGGTNYQPTDMFVDERGHHKALPRNNSATDIYRCATMQGRSAAPTPADPEDLPCILGPAVLFNRRVWF